MQCRMLKAQESFQKCSNGLASAQSFRTDLWNYSKSVNLYLNHLVSKN